MEVNELVGRLRSHAKEQDFQCGYPGEASLAADTLEALAREKELLTTERDALQTAARLNGEIADEARTQLATIMPVVEAAIQWYRGSAPSLKNADDLSYACSKYLATLESVQC